MSSPLSSPPPNDRGPEWLEGLIHQAYELGFIHHGVCAAVASRGFQGLVQWIQEGYAAEMDYFEKRLHAYKHPGGVMEGTKSILVLAYPYASDRPRPSRKGRGRVARYAWSGTDYHDTIHRKLKQLKRWVAQEDDSVSVRGCVDTAPLMERELAELAGMGWKGKNTLLLNRQLGSYFFLACLLFDIELPYDEPHASTHCGTCTACLDQCPTDAFVSPGLLDASRCISYLTIEHRDSIDVDLRRGIGDWIFGCDVCQEVCPWNRKVTRQAETPTSEKPLETVNAIDFFTLNEETFRERFRKTPFWRTRLRGMKRNAAIVLGNAKDQSALPVLREAATNDPDEMVAETCRWAVDQIEGKAE